MAREHGKGSTVALLGGGALALWLVLRGKGWGLGFGAGKGSDGGTNASTDAKDSTVPSGTPPEPCIVWVRSTGIELDGAPADLPRLVERCRAVGAARVNVTGGAISRVADSVVGSLTEAGVRVYVRETWPQGGAPTVALPTGTTNSPTRAPS